MRQLKQEVRKFEVLDGGENKERPTTRGQCESGCRPCPWVSCKWHLYLDVNERTGALKLNFPHLEPWELEDTCALDVADVPGGITLERIGELLNVTRERVRQIEEKSFALLRANALTTGRRRLIELARSAPVASKGGPLAYAEECAQEGQFPSEFVGVTSGSSYAPKFGGGHTKKARSR